MSNSLFDMTGRAALVTGGSKGLGKAMARGLAEAGADVVISSRHEDALKAAASEIGDGAAGKVQYVVADMTNRADVARLAEKAVSAFGRIDVLVNNAGDNKPEPIDQIQDEVWDNIIELNLSSCMALTRAPRPWDERAEVGTDHPHLVDHGLLVGRGPQFLFGHQERPQGLGPGQRQ